MIVTTLAAYLYGGEPDVYGALTAIISKLRGNTGLVENRMTEQTLASLGLTQHTRDGKWYIGNPVNPKENIADRWHEDNQATILLVSRMSGPASRNGSDPQSGAMFPPPNCL